MHMFMYASLQHVKNSKQVYRRKYGLTVLVYSAVESVLRFYVIVTHS